MHEKAPMPSAEKNKQILKAKEIIGLKIMPANLCQLTDIYIKKDACQTQKHPEEYLLSPPSYPPVWSWLAEAEHRGKPMHLASQKSTEMTIDESEPLLAL